MSGRKVIWNFSKYIPMCYDVDASINFHLLILEAWEPDGCDKIKFKHWWIILHRVNVKCTYTIRQVYVTCNISLNLL